MKLGIPSGLFYFKYAPLWENFFENLGCEIIKSGFTSKKIMDLGVKLCVDEACLPVKVYHGHVEIIKNDVDAVFIPRIISISKNEYICPKFCGLPEMIKNSIEHLPYIMDVSINLRRSYADLYDAVMQAGYIITKDRIKIMKAFKQALYEQKLFENRMKHCSDFRSCLDGGYDSKFTNDKPKIVLLGHPYIIYDSYINMNIVQKLSREGYFVLTSQMFDEKTINQYASRLPKRHFWTVAREMLGVGLYILERGGADGIIYISSFCCGIDSLIEDYLQRMALRQEKIPYMKLIVDEHTGEAGFNTRIEAFLDMVKRRKEYESDISTHGRNLYSG